MPILIETHELEALLKDKPEGGLVIFNATMGGQALESHKVCRIPTAIPLDVPTFIDKEAPYMLPFPTTAIFNGLAKKYGFSKDQRFVVYGPDKPVSAGRAYYLLKSFGAKNVQLLNGGLKKWTAESRPTESGEQEITALEGEPGFELLPGKIATFEETRDSTAVKIDTRFPAEFAESHYPGAINMPFTDCLNADGTFKSSQDFVTTLEKLGIDPTKKDQEIITSCTGGISSNTLIVWLESNGFTNVRLFDGSITEYNARKAEWP